MRHIVDFVTDEDGASVVDMTILMAAMAGLAIAVLASVSAGMEVQTGVLESTLISREVGAAW